MPEIRRTLLDMCRPFGPIAHWEVRSANDGLFHCAVRLLDPRKHALMVSTLGGLERRGTVRLAIRIRRRRAG